MVVEAAGGLRKSKRRQNPTTGVPLSAHPGAEHDNPAAATMRLRSTRRPMRCSRAGRCVTADRWSPAGDPMREGTMVEIAPFFSLDGKVAVVTGGASGIGEATAE